MLFPQQSLLMPVNGISAKTRPNRQAPCYSLLHHTALISLRHTSEPRDMCPRQRCCVGLAILQQAQQLLVVGRQSRVDQVNLPPVLVDGVSPGRGVRVAFADALGPLICTGSRLYQVVQLSIREHHQGAPSRSLPGPDLIA